MTYDSYGRYSQEEDEFEKPKRRFSAVSIIIASILILVSIAACILLKTTGLLPTGLFLIVVAAEVIVAGGLALMLFFSRPLVNKVRFWIATVLAVLMVISNGAIIKVSTDYLALTNNIQAPPVETVTYDIVALKTGPASLFELDGLTMAEVKTDGLAGAVHAEVDRRVSVTYVPTQHWTEMVAALKDGEVESMVVQDGFFQLLDEVEPEAFEKMVILASFEVENSLSIVSATPNLGLPNNSYIIYISGVDCFSGMVGKSGICASDVNMLMVVNPDKRKILLVDTQRDYQVQLPGRTTGLKEKLTHAGLYGVETSMAILENLYDINIDYYIRLNFTSMVKVVDALGGIEVESDYAFCHRGYCYTKGTNYLDGGAALVYSRERQSMSGGHLIRGQLQQRVIEGIIKKISEPSVLLRYQQVLSSVSSSLTTSIPQNMMSDQVSKQLSDPTKWEIESTHVYGNVILDYTYTFPDRLLYVMVPDMGSVSRASVMIHKALED
jgi:LCP family protein required for cell wall assembly